jgi:hypothetical protein
VTPIIRPQCIEGFQLKKLLAIFLALAISNAAYSAELFGTVDAISGKARVTDQTGKSVAVAVGLKVYEGQTINTESDGEVHLVTEDAGMIAVRPDTVFRIDEYKAEGSSADKIFMSLLKGSIRSITGWIGKHNTSSYRITTATATIGIRGTDHETSVRDKSDGDEAGTYDNVYEGATVLKTPQGTAEVTPGKFAFAARDKAAAPYFLKQQPHFLASRRLKMEERIPQRKGFLHERFEQMREARIKRQSIHGEQKKIETKKREQVIENHNRIREKRVEQAKRQHEAQQQKNQGAAHAHKDHRKE